jgi:hypothetical protein
MSAKLNAPVYILGAGCTHFGKMSGKAKLIYVSHNITPAPNPRFTPISPYAYGHVELEEGVFIQAIISDIPVDIKNKLKKNKKCSPLYFKEAAFLHSQNSRQKLFNLWKFNLRDKEKI